MCKILVVEDHAGFRQSLNMMLRSRFPSWTIAEAESGKAALELVRSFEPNLVLMDINLPDENGLNLTKTIKANHADIAVIIVTAFDLPEYRQAAFEAGASHFFPKGSLSEEVILKLVESTMAESSSPL